MLATEARKNASELIWTSLPSIIRHIIEDAVNEGKLKCEIVFNEDHVDEFNDYLSFDKLRQEVSKDNDCDYYGTNFRTRKIKYNTNFELYKKILEYKDKINPADINK